MGINLNREAIERIFRAGMARVRTVDIATVVRKSPTLRRFIRGPLADVAEDVMTLMAMVKDYAAGNYREVPERTILTATVALLYIFNPFDLIPDLVPGLGLLDDAAVATMVLRALQHDLQNYRSWTQKVTRRVRQIAARI